MPERPSIDSRQPRDLAIYWCPRCEVQSDGPVHRCEDGAPLFPQTAKETSCQRVRVVPVGAEDGPTEAEIEAGARAIRYYLGGPRTVDHAPSRLARVVLNAARAARKGQGAGE